MKLNPQTAVYFRDELRDARAAALRDAEGFQEILFAIERFGVFLTGKTGTLETYKNDVQSVACGSPLADDVPARQKPWHLAFSELYRLVQEARNDALHQGAFARHLTNSATQLAIVLEDALMSDSTLACHFMVREPLCVSFWQPLSFIRQQMLANSFTYLPVRPHEEGSPYLKIVSDYHLAEYLRKGDRRDCLAKTLEDAETDGLLLERANTCSSNASINEVLEKSKGQLVLVVDQSQPGWLLGIITPFDIL